ncbi:MAG: class I SAM-dependent methyltransferase [Streptosporangiaceae bacterium]
MAEAYQYRPPYPAEVFDVLEQLIPDRPRRVLDIGAGEGALARPLAARVEHVDAVEVSAAMVEAGRRRPGGRRPNLRWIVATAQSAALCDRYALVTAGASLHWMPWEQTFRHLAGVTTQNALLAIVDQEYRDLPWRAELTGIIARHSRSPDYDPGFSLADELAALGLWEVAGSTMTSPDVFRQPIAGYLEHFHSTASLAREVMPSAEAAAFDRAVTDLVQPYAADGMLDMTVVASITWGRLQPELRAS